MKKLFCLVMGVIVLYSCKKVDSFKVDPTTKIANPMGDAVMSLKTITARKASFSKLLTSEEKVVFVQDRLAAGIRDLGLSDEQIAVIDELKRFLTPDLYSDGSEVKNAFFQYEPEWREKAIRIIGRNQLSYLFSFKTFDEYTLAGAKSKLSQISTEDAEPDCDCSHESDWCGWGGAKKACVIPYPDNRCKVTNLGCGTMFCYDCNGRCVSY